MRTTLHMNIDAKLKEQLKALAAKDNRNLTNFIEVKLKELVSSKPKTEG